MKKPLGSYLLLFIIIYLAKAVYAYDYCNVKAKNTDGSPINFNTLVNYVPTTIPGYVGFESDPQNFVLQPNDCYQISMSNGNMVELIMQTDGNMVIYQCNAKDAYCFNASPHMVLWASNTVGHPGAYAVFNILYGSIAINEGQKALWQVQDPLIATTLTSSSQRYYGMIFFTPNGVLAIYDSLKIPDGLDAGLRTSFQHIGWTS